MIKDIIPISLKLQLKVLLIKYKAYIIYFTDIKRYIENSNTINSGDNENKLIGLIIARYHVIEKGLTMPNMRFGFGKSVLITLINDCITFYNNYDRNNIQMHHAIEVINEYKLVHDQNNIPIDREILSKYNVLLKLISSIESSRQIAMTKGTYFSDVNSSFDKFSESRHSLRNFTGKLSIEKISKALELAQNAPSSCNRQTTIVYIVENKETIFDILAIQDGNRGFGHLADKILVLTCDVSSYIGLKERNLQYIDAGIYLMNLLYSLHFYQVGACTLNWNDNPEIDKKIRKILDLHPFETIIALIACGNVPDIINLTKSKRKKLGPLNYLK